MDHKSSYSSYRVSWDKLNDTQKLKTKLFWSEQLTNPQRNAIKILADDSTFASKQITKEREQQSNFNDYARLLHLKKDGKLAVTWNKAFES